MDITQQDISRAAPDSALKSLDLRLRRARIGFGLMLFFGAVELLIGLYSVWFYVTIAALGHEHGWGNIPPEAFPIEPTAIEPTFTALDLLQRGAFILSGAAFLYALTQHRRSLEAVMGGAPFKHGWGWTIGSLFIPLWNFYRPWVGFAEVRRAAFGIARRQRVSLEWQGDGFSTGTLVFGLGYFLGSVAVQGIAKAAERLAGDPNFGLDAVESLRDLLIADVGFRAFLLGLLIWYLRAIGASLRKIDTSFLMASRFD
jgi:hypothetical protein